MCNFVSWIEHEKHVYFLDDDKLNTKSGRALIKYLGTKYREDIPGHGAIRHYYPELKNQGINKECEDFSTPKKFPKQIVSAIKKGKMSLIGLPKELVLLNLKGRAEY